MTTIGNETGCARRTPTPTRAARWAEMQARGTIALRTYMAEPDIADWANACALNPARMEPSQRDEPEVVAAAARLADVGEPGLAGLTALAGGLDL